MKIIDFEKRGNVVRFYLGEDDCKNYTGDDWNDRPYEHNAGQVYDEYIAGYIDIAFSLEFLVQEPADDWRYGGNSPYCKDDFKKRKAPCIVISRIDEYEMSASYSEIVGSDNGKIEKFYFGDSEHKINESYSAGVIIFKIMRDKEEK